MCCCQLVAGEYEKMYVMIKILRPQQVIIGLFVAASKWVIIIMQNLLDSINFVASSMLNEWRIGWGEDV